PCSFRRLTRKKSHASLPIAPGAGGFTGQAGEHAGQVWLIGKPAILRDLRHGNGRHGAQQFSRTLDAHFQQPGMRRDACRLFEGPGKVAAAQLVAHEGQGHAARVIAARIIKPSSVPQTMGGEILQLDDDRERIETGDIDDFFRIGRHLTDAHGG
nr:hypothetical protein [Tanacetum cinerariifolium]